MNACSVQTNGYSPGRSNACVQLPERSDRARVEQAARDAHVVRDEVRVAAT